MKWSLKWIGRVYGMIWTMVILWIATHALLLAGILHIYEHYHAK